MATNPPPRPPTPPPLRRSPRIRLRTKSEYYDSVTTLYSQHQGNDVIWCKKNSRRPQFTYEPGEIINVAHHVPNLDSTYQFDKDANIPEGMKAINPTAAGPVFSKRRYFIVLWICEFKVIGLPLFSKRPGLMKLPAKARREYVGITSTTDRAWEGMARWCGGVLKVQNAGTMHRGYVDLTNLYPIELQSDIARTGARLDKSSYNMLNKMVAYTIRENMAVVYRRLGDAVPANINTWTPIPFDTPDLSRITTSTLVDDPDNPGQTRKFTGAEIKALKKAKYFNIAGVL